MQIGIEPRLIDEGNGEPPDTRKFKPPILIARSPLTGKNEPYLNTFSNAEPLRLFATNEQVVKFSKQKIQTEMGVVTQDVQVRLFGWRRFPNDKSNDSGDHFPYLLVQIQFLNRSCFDDKNVITTLADRWKTIGFPGNYGVFLRHDKLPTYLLLRKMKADPTEAWATFVDRLISTAQQITSK